MRCDEVREQGEAYALGALEPDEREAIDRHAAGCPACRAFLDEITLDVARLALAAPYHRAPRELRARVMQAIAMPPPSLATEQEPIAFISATASAQPQKSLSAGHRSRTFRPWIWLQAAAASIVLLLLLGSTVWIARLQRQVDQLQARSQVLQRGMSDFEGQRAALMLLASNGTARLEMQPTGASADAAGAVIWNAGRRKCSIFAAGLPPAPDGQAYHVWLVSADHSWDSGELVSSGRGTAEKTIDLSKLADSKGYEIVISLQSGQAAVGDRRPVLTAWVNAQ